MQKEEADELSGVKLCKRKNMIIMLGKYLRKKLLEKYEYYFREERSMYEYMTAKVIFVIVLVPFKRTYYLTTRKRLNIKYIDIQLLTHPRHFHINL